MKKNNFFALCLFLHGCISTGSKQPSPDYALADSIHFDHAIIDELRKITPAKFERLVTTIEEYDRYSNQKAKVEISKPEALEFEINDKTLELLSGLKKGFKERGYLVFLSEENFGRAPNKFAVLKSTDQFDILRCRLTRGANYNIGTDSLIKRLKIWYKKYPFEITGAHADWVSADLVRPLADFNALAKELYAFCPDIVDQGTGSVEALAEEMKSTNSLYLWWD